MKQSYPQISETQCTEIKQNKIIYEGSTNKTSDVFSRGSTKRGLNKTFGYLKLHTIWLEQNSWVQEDNLLKNMHCIAVESLQEALHFIFDLHGTNLSASGDHFANIKLQQFDIFYITSHTHLLAMQSGIKNIYTYHQSILASVIKTVKLDKKKKIFSNEYNKS